MILCLPASPCGAPVRGHLLTFISTGCTDHLCAPGMSVLPHYTCIKLITPLLPRVFGPDSSQGEVFNEV